MIRLEIFAVLTLLSMGCSKVANLAMDGLQDTLNGKRAKHSQVVNITNAGTHDLTFDAMIGLPGDDCQPAMDRKESTLRPGESGSLRVEQVCRGRREAWWRVELLRDYNVGLVSVYHPEYFANFPEGASFVYGNREKNIRIPITMVAEKRRVQPIPLSQPVLDKPNVAWVSKQDFYLGDATRWALFIAIPKEFREEKLYIYLNQNLDRVLDMDDPGATKRLELRRSEGIFVAQEILTSSIALTCTDDGCSSAPR